MDYTSLTATGLIFESFVSLAVYLSKVGTPGTDLYRDFFALPGKIREIRILQEFSKNKLKFKKIRCMFTERNSQWEGSFPVEREFPSGKRASRWEVV